MNSYDVINVDNILENKNAFLDFIKDGNSLKLCALAHNSETDILEIMAARYTNLQLSTFGEDSCYLSFEKSKLKEDYDLIVLDSAIMIGIDDSEIEELESVAKQISFLLEKRVTITCLGYLSCDESQEKRYKQFVYLASFLNGKRDIKKTFLVCKGNNVIFGNIDLLNFSLLSHVSFLGENIIKQDLHKSKK